MNLLQLTREADRLCLHLQDRDNRQVVGPARTKLVRVYDRATKRAQRRWDAYIATDTEPHQWALLTGAYGHVVRCSCGWKSGTCGNRQAAMQAHAAHKGGS